MDGPTQRPPEAPVDSVPRTALSFASRFHRDGALPRHSRFIPHVLRRTLPQSGGRTTAALSVGGIQAGAVWLLACMALLAPALATAQVVEEYTYTVNAQIPDYPDEFGYEDIRTVSGSAISIIGDVNVYLTITGGYLGDLFVSLSHGSGYAVLLNRPGRRSGDALGYGDSGLDNALFDDAASDGDVHVYRLTLSGDHTTPLGGPLGGSWAPDARTTNPTSVLDTDARNALLSSFNDLGTDGEWSLRLFDYNAGGTATLVSWTLVVTAPEPSSYAAIFAAVCALGAFIRRWRDRLGLRALVLGVGRSRPRAS
ncbi:MAG: PEP-CTERM sorting domain-containing protein [Verrucomicrobia bacterium]|nr:PEP-CTERM sorting domain-containing protein [Verrucomicrobiota bacterium]